MWKNIKQQPWRKLEIKHHGKVGHAVPGPGGCSDDYTPMTVRTPTPADKCSIGLAVRLDHPSSTPPSSMLT